MPSGVLEEVLHVLFEAALRRTHADRVFVFVRHNDGDLDLLAGRDTNGPKKIEQGNTISHDAVSRASEYLEIITDDTGRYKGLRSHSQGGFLCLPLFQTVFHDEDSGNEDKLSGPACRQSF
jgi:hypothetical protein